MISAWMPFFLEQAGQKSRARQLVARRVRRIDAHVLLQQRHLGRDRRRLRDPELRVDVVSVRAM